MPNLCFTSLSAIILAAIYFAQTFSVIGQRRSQGIVYGDGDNKTMMKRMRGHGNSAEQIPIFLILLALAELNGANVWSLGSIAAIFTAGRLSHGYYFLDIGAHHRFRRIGMLLTLTGQLLALILLAASLL